MNFLNFSGENVYLFYGIAGLAILSILTFVYFQFSSLATSKVKTSISHSQQHQNEIYGMEETSHYAHESEQEPIHESHSVEEPHGPEPNSCDDGKCFI